MQQHGSLLGVALALALALGSTAQAQPTAEPPPAEQPQPPPPAEQPPPTASSGDVATTDFIASQKDGTRLFRREARAARRASAIQIDGALDETAWLAAPAVRFEWQERPSEGAKATGPTDFRILYDDKALYVGLHALDPEPAKIVGLLHPSLALGKIPQSDWLIVSLDPARTRRMAYIFGVNAAGVKVDLRQSPGKTPEDTYEPVWEAKTRRDHTGWYAEIRIPYSQMRVRDGFQDRWGLQVQRKVSRAQERDYWSPFSFASGTELTGFGNLAIEDKIDAGRPLEILPYVLGGARIESALPGDDRLHDRLGPAYGLGADVKLQVARSLRLTASINPDFGQIEADPSEVNLTDKETFFSERRPLFIEDADLYELKIGRGDETLFYSRRIGAPPTFSQADAALYVDEPDATTIYGAAKLSGELGAGVSIGLLSALGAKEVSRGQLETGAIEEAVVEPMTSYNVAQLTRPFRDGASELRATATAVSRFGERGPTTALHDRAYAGALQYSHQLAENRWELFGMLGGSRVEGTPEAIALTQAGSQRYFQRPDATHVALDPARTSLSGYAFNAQLKKIAGTYHAELGVDGRSPGFEVNDTGFLIDADQIKPWLKVSREDPAVDGDVLQEVALAAEVESAIDFAPDVLRSRGTLSADLVFANLWSAGAALQATRTALDTHLLRGGPAVRGEDAVTGSVYMGTDVTRDFQVSLSGAATTRPASDSLKLQLGLGLLWDVRSNLELQLNPALIRNVDDSQYVGAAMDGAGGARYVLGRLRQTTLAATARFNYVISPRMSIQLYVNPFLSGGTYSGIKEVSAPRERAYEDRFTRFGGSQVMAAMGQLAIDADGDGVADFSVRRPDFKVAALISNLVYRWEYLPGSNLYVIWSQARNGFAPDGTLAARDAGDVFTNPSVHVVMVKLSYWWNL
ncbi:MAG TPA: DUF5916 domain-containing protein [Kofleriaceae bacterium]|nr:DUF5916 domain-containing protein [Kofleriaceae bacterium]